MRVLLRFVVILALLVLVGACSEEPKKEYKEPDWDRLTRADKTEPARVIPSSPAEPVSPQEKVAPTAVPMPDRSSSAGGVTMSIRPDRPSDQGCLRAMVKGQPGRPVYQWFVNGVRVPNQTDGRLCNDKYQRGDEVTAQVGTNDQGASATVTIGNTPPRILEVSATAQQAFEHGDITMSAVGADADGDEVTFLYQWIINGEEAPFLTSATLLAGDYAKGDQIKVRITPYDGFDEGTPYESDALAVPNAPPVITSKPPQNFEAHLFSYQVEASDPDDTNLNFSLTDPPDGMIIGSGGLISWPLTEVEPGRYKVSIVVADPEGETATQEFTLDLSKKEVPAE